jgi:hypothetical protein
VPDFGRVFLTLKYADITQNTHVQSWTVTDIMAREQCGLLAGPRTVPVSWHRCLSLSKPWDTTLDESFPNRWLGHGGPIAWPPRSPDLTPLDYYIWGHMKLRSIHEKHCGIVFLQQQSTYVTIQATMFLLSSPSWYMPKIALQVLYFSTVML